MNFDVISNITPKYLIVYEKILKRSILDKK